MGIFNKGIWSGETIVNIGWDKNVEKSLDVEGLREYGYISGYKDAADCLVEKYIGTSMMNSMIYPIVYLYRQYLELLFKNIDAKLPHSTRLSKSNAHNINDIWNSISAHLNLSKEKFIFISAVVDEFTKIDPKSSNFRYFWKYGKKDTLQNEISIDVILLKSSIDEIDKFLYGTYA
jgi:hypothetical protein